MHEHAFTTQHYAFLLTAENTNVSFMQARLFLRATVSGSNLQKKEGKEADHFYVTDRDV